MDRRKVLVFASGTPEGGGSGFKNLVLASRGGVLEADIAGVVSNHANGGVRRHADTLGIPFVHFSKPWTGEVYQEIARQSKANFFALSGWVKPVLGLNRATRFNPQTVFNIHPGPLPQFGGKGLYGHYVHEAVMAAFHRGEITHTGVCMHFVDDEYDHGPSFFKIKIKINDDDTPDSLGKRVNHQYEHPYQPPITNLVVNGLIRWDGVNPASLTVPAGYSIEQCE